MRQETFVAEARKMGFSPVCIYTGKAHNEYALCTREGDTLRIVAQSDTRGDALKRARAKATTPATTAPAANTPTT